MVADNITRTSLLFIATGVAMAGCYWLRDLLAPFALAIFIWLMIDGAARGIDRRLKFVPYWVGLIVSVLLVVAGLVIVLAILTDTARDIAVRAPEYQDRLEEIVAPILALPGINPEWLTLNNLAERFNLGAVLGGLADGLQNLVGNGVLIAIYVAFLFAAQNSFPGKMDAIFPESANRETSRQVGNRIRASIENYLWVQTLVSLVITILSYVIMSALGLDNALFWAFVIFILNYIPTIGSIIAVILPTAFALMQFDELWRVGVLAASLGLWQFSVGNFVQPRLMSDQLNLSALVVLLSLALWGFLWGGIGVFLSAPLTVMLMIILSQFATTRWLAILLSADGKPDNVKTKPS